VCGATGLHSFGLSLSFLPVAGHKGL